jgi:hypothetical protein
MGFSILRIITFTLSDMLRDVESKKQKYPKVDVKCCL